MRRFDPQAHAEVMLPLLRELVPLLAVASERAQSAVSSEALRPILRRHPAPGRGFYSRAELIAGLRAFSVPLGLGEGADALASRLRMRPVRTQSGVTPVTVLTKPFPCPGQCVFCPNDVRMPKSYLSREPGAQRAEQNDFDPYLQTYNRLLALRAIGHSVQKAELIILGGTFSFYPERYQRWFVTRCFEALRDFGSGHDARDEVERGNVASLQSPREVERGGSPLRARPAVYNRTVVAQLRRAHGPLLARAHEDADWERLARVQRDNESQRCRNVGLVIETRPDHVTEAELVRLRKLGCTKVQLGVQSLNDATLAANRRGHDVASVRRAMRLLRLAGFKVLAHLMPNLLGSTPELDLADARAMFDDPDFRPDELKVYPCSLVPTAELMRFYATGDYRPYAHDELLEVLAGVLAVTPRYCRLSRVVRDISSEDIVAGNRLANLREPAEALLASRGRPCRDIRAREVRHGAVEPKALVLRVTEYETSVGAERFIELCTPEDRLAGFVRLSLPREPTFLDELRASAIIRELHVYGEALELGTRTAGRPQHRGLGQRLVAEACAHARKSGHATLSVISAVGTRPYYRRLGFTDGDLYQHLAL